MLIVISALDLDVPAFKIICTSQFPAPGIELVSTLGVVSGPRPGALCLNMPLSPLSSC